MIGKPPPWPNGARSAVAFSFDVDADSVVHASHRAKAPEALAAIAHMRYDPHVGLPRLVDLFRSYAVPITCFVPGWVADAYRNSVEYILTGPNEIAHHGHFHEWPSQQSQEAERESLNMGIERIVSLTGRRPAGYRAPYYGLSASTFDLLIEEGLLYDSSLFADDVPIILESRLGRLVELPPPASVDDYSQYVSARAFDYLMNISPPSRALEVFRSEFDAIHEIGGLFVSVWHPAVSGRPSQARAIRALIEHMMDTGGVWFATLEQVARHVMGLIAAGAWSPRVEKLPFYDAPVLR